MALKTPYLEAIQTLPGNTPEEKYKWMGQMIKGRISTCNNLEEVLESEKIPRPLVPLIQIETAKVLNKKNSKDQSNYEAIAEALKSEDETIVHRALKASSFFDGSNKKITSIDYFFNHLFPYVALNTRIQIIKMLAYYLAPKETSLAEEFFSAIASTYNVQQALPLLTACSESFAYDAIIKYRIILSEKLIELFFRKNPEFVIRYLKLSIKKPEEQHRCLHHIPILRYTHMLVKLIKKHLKAFIEIYEANQSVLTDITLSNKCAETLLKNGKEYVQEKPQAYIDILPLKLINATCMETIFPKLFPEDIEYFRADSLLKYLEHYPQDKKLSLLTKSYKEVYQKNILDDWKNVTPKLMRMLPTEERIKQVKIKMQKDKHSTSAINYKYIWRCYLPTQEVIPEIKKEIARTPESEIRTALLCQLIYTCKVNNDDAALLEVLTYLRDRHKNEIFMTKPLDTLLSLYDVPLLSKDHWVVIYDIMKWEQMKNELPPTHSVNVQLLEAAAHFRLIHNLPMDDIINMIVDIKSMKYTRTWNILQKYPEYERKCLEACLDVVSKRYETDKSLSLEDKGDTLYDLVVSIYDFNKRHAQRNLRVKKMFLKNYPWLMKEIELFIAAKIFIYGDFKSLFRENEKDLLDRFWEEDITSMNAEEALASLKKDPNHVLKEWEKYYEWCKDNYHRKDTKRFVRALRWYKDIPMKFVQKCIQDVTEEKCGVSLYLLAFLIHGHTFAEFIAPLIPNEKVIDVKQEDGETDYALARCIPRATNIANPPVPLDLIGKMCEGDYLSVALKTLTNLCRRTSTAKVISFAKTLSNKRVSVRKHGIRLLYMVAPYEQLSNFLSTQWKTENHYSIRHVLLTTACDLHRNDLGPTTWSLLNGMVSTFRFEDEKDMSNLINMISVISNEYLTDYLKLLLKIIDNFIAAGLERHLVILHVTSILKYIDTAVFYILPEEFTKELFKKYLFAQHSDISKYVEDIIVTSLLLSTQIDLDLRIRFFSGVFVEAVKSGWDVPHPEKSHYFPVNNGVQRLIGNFVYMFTCFNGDPRIVDSVLSTFLSVLTPQVAPTPYLLLLYTKDMAAVKTPKEFGLKVGRRIPELVEIFSTLFVPFMARTLDHRLENGAYNNYDKQDAILDVIEGLLEVDSVVAKLVAVELFSPLKIEKCAEKYKKIVQCFKRCENPAISSTFCDIVNATAENDTVFDEV